MSDYNSSLPIRTQNNGDVVAKIGDATIPSQQLAVNADGSINITDNAGSITVDGTVELGATSLAALESITVQNGSGGSAVNIQDGGNSLTVDGTVELGATTLAALESITVVATDLDIRDLTHVSDSVKIGDGTDLLAVNADGSINVVISNDVAGTEICAYNTSASVAAAASVNFDYTVNTAVTLIVEQAFCSGSGKVKAELKVETAAASGVYNTKFVAFNSTSHPTIIMPISRYLKQVTGAKVRITLTNLDNQAQDLYSTLTGSES